MADLKHCIAVVAGAGRGAGRAMAQELRPHGVTSVAVPPFETDHA